MKQMVYKYVQTLSLEHKINLDNVQMDQFDATNKKKQSCRQKTQTCD